MLPSISEAVCCCEGWIGVWQSDPADFVVNCIEDNEGQGDYENEDKVGTEDPDDADTDARY